ncbi:hypothetical protein P0L94_00925 [Microbacter sp. GSS18]|nr:hypothetical protein P0L94_00925 [Microbacter sp. GSS18]
MTMKKSYHESELDHVPAVMLGGPIDGKRYKLPVFPEDGIPTGFSTPLREPHETSPHAHYLREGDEPVGGYFVFFYDRTTGPNGESYREERPHRTRERFSAPETGGQR